MKNSSFKSFKFQKYILLLCFLLFASNLVAQIKGADKKIDSILQGLSQKKLDKKENNQTLGIIGKLNYPKKSKKIISNILEFSQQQNDKNQLVNAYYAMGNYYFFNAKLDSSLICIKKAESYLQEGVYMPLLKASLKMTKGGVYKRKGNLVTANHNYLEALKILDAIDTLTLSKRDKIKRNGNKMILFNSIAIFNKGTKNYEKANFYYEKAYHMAISLNDKRIASILLSNQGDLLLETKEYDKALEILTKSKKLKQEINYSQSSITLTDLNIALVYLGTKDYGKALAIFNKIIPVFETKNNQNNLTYALVGRGQLFLQTNKFTKAIADCERAYNFAKKSDNIAYQSVASECLSDAYSKIEDYKKAFFFQQKHTSLKDSIFNTNNVKKITQMQMQYDFDKKNELQAVEIKNKAKENKIIIISLALGILSLLFFSAILYKQFQNRKKNNRLLAIKNTQIQKALADNEVLLKETHHRVKNSLQMISSLLYLQSENIEDKKAAASVKDGQIRVKSMALIHQKLYQKENLTGVEVSDYINDLAESIFQSHKVSNDKIKLRIDVEKLILDIDTITPIGIIINELIVNALKHAFSKETTDAEIRISLHKKDNILLLTVTDNGKGFNPADKKEKSFGLKLINSLSRKLKADLTITHKNGTLVELKIKRFIIKQ
ncbi:MAG TPA: hypothetical protein ENK46_03785 [Flavobacteriia bacterium]|nr:hypothetical protein [Flavobacteriia bacterium]